MENLNDVKERMRQAYLVTVIATLLLFAMVFLPYASAKGEFRKGLLENPDLYYVEEIGLTNKDAVHLSLLDYAKVYHEAMDQGMDKELCVVVLAIIGIFVGLSAFSFIFALFKKPIAVLLFDILTLIAFRLIHFDFKDRGVIPSSAYNWGMADILGTILAVIVIGTSIWLWIMKRRYKKCKKLEQANKIEG